MQEKQVIQQNTIRNGKNHQFLAHFRQTDEVAQSLEEHLKAVGNMTRRFAAKIGLPTAGRLIGLLHDLGKYSDAFQKYIRSAVGQINPDEDDYVDAVRMKGKIDHSTSGAQYIWNIFQKKPEVELLAGQIMALCVASHHSGLIDCLSPLGEDVFSTRMKKSKEHTHLNEALSNVDETVQKMIQECLNGEAIEKELSAQLKSLFKLPPSIGTFQVGMLTRFLFSALIDADRLDSANFDEPARGKVRDNKLTLDWSALISKLELHLANFKERNRVDRIRTEISSHCEGFSTREKGLYLLTVPTGGGKTLASLRFALHHAKKYGMERIIYVIPYTSIIDQNASEVRSILEDSGTSGSIVLEHHSNLTPKNDTWKSKILAENWDAQIVFTTAVQFLETLFGSGTRGARRMHQLANAVIVFDEIQTIPIRTIHMFNNALNFLVSQCGTTALFCTATQPILDQVDKGKGAAKLSANPEMMDDVGSLFRELRRVRVADMRKNGGWEDDEIATLAIKEFEKTGSVLVIVNTKAAAQNIYKQCKEKMPSGGPVEIFHLSTNMCPVHRMTVLEKVKTCLNPDNPKPVICVSTQLIEAGVNIDFGCVIRYLAGIDSIAQAAGRCNRNGLHKTPGTVLIVNPVREKPPNDIKIAQEKAERVLDEFKKDPAAFDHDLISPKTIELYYRYYFFDRKDEMVYPVSQKQIGRDGDLLSLLSMNTASTEAYKRSNKGSPKYLLQQSFKSAGEAFEAINAPTEGVIVPYGEGEQIIKELCAAFDVRKQYALLKRAQRYSVNVFPNVLQQLGHKRSVQEVQEGSGILYLDAQHYSDEFGVSLEISEPMQLLYI